MTSCREAALAYLARRAHAKKELARKLRRKGYGPGEIEATLDALVARGLLDDSATAASLAISRTARGIGRRRIASELRGRGVSAEAVDEALAGIGTEDERAALRTALEKRRRALPSGLTPPARSKKLFDHLVRRGFSPAAVLEELRQKGDPSDDPE